MADAGESQVVRVPCTDCGGWPKNHRVLHEAVKRYTDYEGGEILAETRYQICECLGCDRISFREASTRVDDIDAEGNEREQVQTYPYVSRREHHTMSLQELPKTVARIYQETITVFNAGAMILAGGGLRAIVEAICLDRQVQGKNLQEKINDLVAKGLLARPQADLLHEERYIGNAALHELQPPSREELRDGIKIVETLLSTIYELPAHAAKLQRARQSRKP